MNFWDPLKEKTRAIQTKLHMTILENRLEDNFLRLGSLKEDFRAYWQEEAKEPKFILEKGGGTVVPMEFSPLSPVKGKKIKDVESTAKLFTGTV